MKVASVKELMVGPIFKRMMAVLAAGVLMAVGPAKAEAQGLAAGVQFRAPHRGYDRYAFERREEFLRREALLRHQEWLRAHRLDRPYR